MTRALMGQRAGTDFEEAIEDTMGLFGTTRSEATRALGIEAPGKERPRVEVLACCLDAVRLFAGMAGQWRMAIAVIPSPVGPQFINRRTGLDLSALDVVAGWLGLDRSPDLLADLRIMETEALAVMDEVAS